MLQIECDFVYWWSQIDIMKALFLVSTLFLIVSCGKYERPFISFKSPEKRLMDKTWRCVKAIDSAGNEFEVYDHITFDINGSDSTFSRVTNHKPLNQNWYSEDTTSTTGTWTWGPTTGDGWNKQIITLINIGENFQSGGAMRHHRVTVLSKKELVIQDQTFDNTTYHYAPL